MLLTPLRNGTQLVGIDNGASGIIRTGDNHGLGHARKCLQVLGSELETSLGTAVDLNNVGAERLQRIAVCGIARAREHDVVANIEGCEEERYETAGRTGSDDNISGFRGRAVVFTMPGGDGCTQLRRADGRCVAQNLIF